MGQNLRAQLVHRGARLLGELRQVAVEAVTENRQRRVLATGRRRAARAVVVSLGVEVVGVDECGEHQPDQKGGRDASGVRTTEPDARESQWRQGDFVAPDRVQVRDLLP